MNGLMKKEVREIRGYSLSCLERIDGAKPFFFTFYRLRLQGRSNAKGRSNTKGWSNAKSMDNSKVLTMQNTSIALAFRPGAKIKYHPEGFSPLLFRNF
jgi:hypothetical protein